MGAEKTLVNDMSQGPVLKGLIRFAIPMILANLLQAVYSMVDMIVVGQFGGPAGLSAVGIGGQLTNLFLAVGMGFSNGAQVVISQQVGMKSKKISKTIGTLLTTELLLAVIVGAIGIVFHQGILGLMNTPSAAWDEAVGYLVICSCGMIFIYGYNALCAVLRGMGESKLPMVFIAVASLVNVVLDLVFVGGFHWGASGAAAATVIAQGVSFFCAAVYLYRHKEAVQFDFRFHSFAIDREQLGALCRLGIPSVVQQFLITISITFVNAQVNAYDVTASAVDSVGGKLNTVANIITGAISTAAATMIAQSFGAREMDRVKHAFRACMIICMAWWVILSACYLLFPRQIFGLFTTDEQVLELAPTYLRYAVIWLLALCSMDAPYALVQGVGFASFNLVVGLLDGVVARIGLSLVLGHIMGLTGFWLGSGLAGFVTTIAMGIYYLTGRWEKREAITQ
jgi:putative MATE family efflux protein